MRKAFYTIAAVVCCTNLLGQEKYVYKKQPAFGIHFVFYDFASATSIRQNGFGETWRSGLLTNLSNMQAGLALTYHQGLTNHLDIVGRYSGSFLDYPFRNQESFGSDNLYSALDVMINAKLSSDYYWLSPYISGGIGTYYYSSTWGAYMPLGIGLQLNLFDEAYVFFNAQFHVGVSDEAAHTLYYSIGIAGNISSNKPKAKKLPVFVNE